MRPNIKHGCSSFGTLKGDHTGGHSTKKFSHFSAGHHGSNLGTLNLSHHSGAHMSHHHGGAHASHHGGSHLSHHGGSHLSHHGGSHLSHHGGSHLSHHGGSHSSHLARGSHLSHHGGSHLSHHGGSHLSHHGGSHLSHHGGSHSSHVAGGSHFSHHGGSNLTSHGNSHLSHHGSSHLTHYGGGPHLSFHGGSQLSHHKSNLSSSHMSHHGSPTKMHHGSSHMSHHGGSFKNHGESHKSYHGGSHNIHCGGHHKSGGAHGGSSSKSVSFSKHSSMSHHGGHGHDSHFSGHSSWKNDGLLGINEKQTMQMLNDRLSSYLDKVSALEQENAQLERKISEWYANNAPSSLPDSSQYFRIISDVQNQIAAASMENARIVLQIDNARLTADDFREKYEMELSMSNNTEADVNALRRVLEGLNRDNCDLEMQVQNLQGELQEMKRNHEEEANSLRAQLGARINVELNAAPSIDLNGALTEIRDEYENLMERNLSDVEDMFRQRSEELNRQVMSGSEQLQSVQTEVIELNRTIQTLEIELQSQMSMTTALESTLAETQATYNSQIAQLQAMINNVECQLAQIRSDLERQNYEYKILMDQKTHLEMEIATYKRLIDGHDIHVSDYGMSSGKHGSHHTVGNHTTEHHHESKC